MPCLPEPESLVLQQHLQAISVDDLDNPLWQFACQSYAIAGVSDALLELQDEHGQNICWLLFVLWLQQQDKTEKPLTDNAWIDRALIKEARALACCMDKLCIAPVRQSRRAQKALLGADAIYKQTQALELALEQRLIAILYRLERQTLTSLKKQHSACFYGVSDGLSSATFVTEKLNTIQQLIRV